MDVWLHVGAGKTGTSAIQAALAQGREQLAEAGLFYPRALNPRTDAMAEAGGITSGNGLALGWMLCPSRRDARYDASATRAWLRRALMEAGGRTILFSSEFMQLPEPAAIPPVLDLLTEHGRRRLRVLHFSRHALDHAVAGYAQILKTAAIRPAGRTLEQHLSTIGVPFLRQLETWAAAVGREAVVARLYDEDRDALVRAVLGCVHPDAVGVLPDSVETMVVNRSPTPTEMRLLHRLSAEPDADVQRMAFVNGLLNAPPAVPEALTLGEAAVAAFAADALPVVDALNRDWLLPAGRAPIRLSAGRIRVGTPPPTDPARLEAALGAAFIATVRHLIAEMAPLRRRARQAERRLKRGSDRDPGRRRDTGRAPEAATLAGARRHAQAGRTAEALAMLVEIERLEPSPGPAMALRERLERRLVRQRGGP